MVATRRSRKSNEAKQKVDGPSEEAVNSTGPNEEASSKTPSKRSSRKKRQKEELKSKNTGVGLSISIDDEPSTKSNKLIFDYEKVVVADEGEPQATAETDRQDQENEEDDKVEKALFKESDEEDDAVEEVKGSAAREEILQQLEAEEKGALKTKKKKKRKDRKTEVPDDVADDDLDDDFFALLETVKKEEQTKKQSESKKKKKGKHTTFVFGENDKSAKGVRGLDPSKPKKVGHNIQVVVLPDEEDIFMDDAITAVPATALSEEALIYSRSHLNDGSDRGGKRKRNAPNLPDTSWKRSRKMSLLMTPKSRFNRRGGRGCPAANFASKSQR